jgi:hypothetical protein
VLQTWQRHYFLARHACREVRSTLDRVGARFFRIVIGLA